MSDTPPNDNVDNSNLRFDQQKYADLNSQIRPKSYKPVRTSYSSRIGEIRNALNERVKDNETEGVNEFLARVLRVENKNNDNQDDSGVINWFGSLFEDEKVTPPVITAIIDADVHALAWGRSGVGHPDFILPNDNGQGGSANANDIINKIRDAHKGKFTAPNNGVPVPKVGELVWVTFADLENRKDGVYLRPLIDRDSNSDVDSNSQAGDNNSKKDPCNKLKSKRPKGRSTRNKNAAAGSRSNRGRKESIDAKKERGQPPIGKGVFTGFPDVKTHKVSQALHCSLNFVCYTGLKQDKDGNIESANISKIKKFAKKYHKNGIRTYIMGYPAYGHEEQFLAKLFSLANSGDAIGVILNLDHYYGGKAAESPYEKENYLMSEFKKYADKKNFATGLTATDIAANPNIPWKIFAEPKTGVDFAIPQVFAQEYNSLRDQQIEKAAPTPPPEASEGQPTSFDSLLPGTYHDIAEIAQLPEGFLEKWDSSTGFDSVGGENSDFNVRSLFMKAAAEIVEQYWKQILPGQNPKVFITSHHRPGAGKGNHTTGGAFDIRIELGDHQRGEAPVSDRVPVLQTWASLKKLQLAGRIPLGGTGIYLNTETSGTKTGISGLRPDQAGSITGGTGLKAGPGGSAAPHYDMRGFLYVGGGKTRNTIWVNLDTNADGKDDIKSSATARSRLRKDGLGEVADYLYRDDGTWANDGNYTDGYLPAVGPGVQNMLQVLGLDSQPPVEILSSAEGPFVKKFMAWKQTGFKHIVPGLGMIGDSPNPNGWIPDAYNTVHKSPARMREDATWTFTSVKDALGTSMANAAIWWDWEGASRTAVNWPEKRWDVIRELGDAIATAQKLNKIKNSSISQVEKDKIINWQLGTFMKSSDSPGEAKTKQQKKEDPPPEPPADKTPSETPAEATPTPSGLTEEKRQEIQNNIDNRTKQLKAKEAELSQLKTELTNAQNAGTNTDTQLAAIKTKTEEIRQEVAQINNLRAQLGQEAIAGSSGEPKDPCANLTLGKPTKIDPELPGVEFLDYGLKKGKPLKSRSYVVIHEPGGGTKVEGVLRYLKKEGNSVHFTVSMRGKVQQHASMQLATFHAGNSVNYNSIGIEVMNPSPEGAPGKKYKPGSRQQLEALWTLAKKIAKAGSPEIPLSFVAAAKNNEPYKWREKLPLKPGIHAHRMQGNTNHSDGAFPVLYMSLRNQGLGPGDAYKKALDLFSKKSGVKVPLVEQAAPEETPETPSPETPSPETAGS